MKWKFIKFWANSREGLIKYHAKTSRSLLQFWSVKSARRKIILIPICLLLMYFFYDWTISSNSCALHAFLCLICFDIAALIGDTICQFYTHGKKATSGYSFGFVRAEVLIHFFVLCLAIFLNIWSAVYSFQTVFYKEFVEISKAPFFPSIFVGGIIHFFFVLPNNPFTKVLKQSSITTKFQRHAQDVANALGINSSTATNPLLSPFAVLGIFYVCILFSLTLVLYSRLLWVDFIVGLFLIYASMDLIWPLTLITSQVLLQTVPSNVASQLEKALREASTVDGVLEFRNELFWTLTYGQTAGVLHVRVRRDANEQVILSKVFEKLVDFAPHLTIQIIKDDMGRGGGSSGGGGSFGSVYQIGRDLTSVQMEKSDLGLTPSEISPIPQPPSHLKPKQLIYSSASSSHTHPEKPSLHQPPNFGDDSNNLGPPSSFSNVSSSLFNFEVPHTRASPSPSQGFTPYYESNNHYSAAAAPQPLQQQPPPPLIVNPTHPNHPGPNNSAFYPLNPNSNHI